MKRKLMVLVSILLITFIPLHSTSAKENRDIRIVKQYCNRHYNNKKLKFISDKKLTAKKLKSRKKKKIVYVEILRSVSKGKHGITRNGHYIRYNQKVKKGKKIKSYLIYNPNTKFLDDVIAVVDNGKIR